MLLTTEKAWFWCYWKLVYWIEVFFFEFPPHHLITSSPAPRPPVFPPFNLALPYSLPLTCPLRNFIFSECLGFGNRDSNVGFKSRNKQTSYLRTRPSEQVFWSNPEMSPHISRILHFPGQLQIVTYLWTTSTNLPWWHPFWNLCILKRPNINLFSTTHFP